MGRGKRPVRGGKRKLERRQDRRPNVKKKKFNLREATYVQERDCKNEEIEKQRRMKEEEKARQEQLETDTSEDEQDPTQVLLATLPNASKNLTNSAILSSTESEISDEEDGKNEEKESAVGSDIVSDSYDSNIEEQNSVDHNKDQEIVIEIQENNEEDEETAQEDAGHLRDPFSIHLRHDMDDKLYRLVSSTPQIAEKHKLYWPTLENIVCEIPKPEDSLDDSNKKSQVSILDNEQYTKCGTIPILMDNVNWNKLYIKSQIQNNITKANYDNIKHHLDENPSPLTPLQKELFSLINNYQDVYYPERKFSNAHEIRVIYCLHAINHALKTRTKVLHHNAKLAKSKIIDMGSVPDEYRDQGLVRPKILIIVPFRHSCLQIVEILISILIGEEKGGSVMNKKRFLEDFGGHELFMPKKNPKPEDYELTFQGNTDDTFRIGISITKKTLKLYSDFYSSDIIIASMLGLRMLIGAEGETDRDYDFLASIELLIMDQTEIFLMQNWDHVIHVFNHLHLQPKDSHGTDFSRVRSWNVNGWAKYYRQTLLFSAIQTPEINAIFNKKCFNYAGKHKIINPISHGSICQVVIQVPLIFHRFGAKSHAEALENRMQFFISKILPQYTDTLMNHTVIYVPSYFDYVKLRNYLKKNDRSFVQICEYSKDAKIARARDMFFHSDAHFLLYSERFHFFRRINLKGIRHIIFYAPPMIPHFFNEMCNLMQETNQNPKAGSQSNMTITTIYSKYDMLQLSAIVGTERASKMIHSEKSVHMLMTGD